MLFSDFVSYIMNLQRNFREPRSDTGNRSNGADEGLVGLFDTTHTPTSARSVPSFHQAGQIYFEDHETSKNHIGHQFVIEKDL